MKKNMIWIYAAVVAVALLVFLLLLPGRDLQAPEESTGIGATGSVQPSAETTDPQLSADPTQTQPTGTTGDESRPTQDPADGGTKPTQGGNQQPGNTPTDPTVSAGVVEQWPDEEEPTKSTEPETSESKPTEPDKETEPKSTEPEKETEPDRETEPKKDMRELTYAQYTALSPEDQQRFYEAFCEKYGEDAFFEWFKAAKAVYDAEQAEGVVSGDGNIDISDYIGGN